MTVIAWDGSQLVTDGRTTMGFSIVTDSATKIHKFEHAELGDVYGAFCGAVMAVEPWIDHMSENGFDAYDMPEDLKECGVSGIIVTSLGKAMEIDSNGTYHTVERSLAYGSGALLAQHFLNTGHNAVDAVRAAIKSDASCGGRILAWDWKAAKFHVYAK